MEVNLEQLVEAILPSVLAWHWITRAVRLTQDSEASGR